VAADAFDVIIEETAKRGTAGFAQH
jgi:hypothetical protein